MKIGLDANEANVTSRVGSQEYCYQLICKFSKNTKHQFTSYIKDKPISDLPKENENFRYKVFGPRKLWTQIALPLKLSFGPKLDVFATLGHYGPRFSKIPYAVTIHDLSYLHFPELFERDDLFQLTNWSKHSILNSSHIFAISQSTKDDIIKNYKVESNKITVTYMGYDDKNFKVKKPSEIKEIIDKYKLPNEYIIFIGTLQPRKNIEKLIEAFNQIINSQRPGARELNLVIVGKKGWLYDSIFKKVKELNLENRVIFTDFVPKQDLPLILSGAKAYVLPSLWEGFGIPVIEAQACGVPTIVSKNSSLPEVVKDSGILIDPLSTASIVKAIEKLTSDEQFAQKLKKLGLLNVKRFSWEKCADITLGGLEKIAHRNH